MQGMTLSKSSIVSLPDKTLILCARFFLDSIDLDKLLYHRGCQWVVR